MRSTEIDKPYDAGDRESVAEKTKQAKVREAKRLNGLKQIMASQDGRLWMWDFLSTCGLFSVNFNGNSRDYFQLGMRNAAMPIFADIQNHCMDDYLKMVKETSNV